MSGIKWLILRTHTEISKYSDMQGQINISRGKNILRFKGKIKRTPKTTNTHFEGMGGGRVSETERVSVEKSERT